jgi:hypothetical protein
MSPPTHPLLPGQQPQLDVEGGTCDRRQVVRLLHPDRHHTCQAEERKANAGVTTAVRRGGTGAASGGLTMTVDGAGVGWIDQVQSCRRWTAVGDDANSVRTSMTHQRGVDSSVTKIGVASCRTLGRGKTTRAPDGILRKGPAGGVDEECALAAAVEGEEGRTAVVPEVAAHAAHLLLVGRPQRPIPIPLKLMTWHMTADWGHHTQTVSAGE